MEFSATDWLHPTRAPQQGNTSAMYITSTEFDELRSIFDKLSNSANQDCFVDLRDMPFGTYGRLTNRYGIEWFFRGEKATH